MYQKFVAELIGTCTLVLIGCGSAIISNSTIQTHAGTAIGTLGVSLAFGLAVLVMAYTIGPISGCHINPAVTISMLVAGKIKLKEGVTYVFAQLLGAALGSAILSIMVFSKPGAMPAEWGLGANGWGPGYQGEYPATVAFLAEVVFSFLFLFVIHSVTSKNGNKNTAGIVIGITLVLIHLASIPITGTSVNPARSFGPAIIVGGTALKQLWLFTIAPILGGAIAALVWKNIFERN